MYRQFIGKRDDSQEAPAKLIHSAPKTIPVVPLKFCTNGRANDLNAHVLGEVRSLAHNLIFKIWREPIARHASSILRTQRAGKKVWAKKGKLRIKKSGVDGRWLIRLRALRRDKAEELYLARSRSARPLPHGFTGHVARPSRSVETRSFPNSLVAYPGDFTFYVARPDRSVHSRAES